MAAPRNVAEMRAKAEDAGRQYNTGRPSCVYCGCWIGHKRVGRKVFASKFRLTIDHFIPRGKGGPNNSLNRVPACEPCNTAKADMDPADFVLLLGERSRLTIGNVEHARLIIQSPTAGHPRLATSSASPNQPSDRAEAALGKEIAR